MQGDFADLIQLLTEMQCWLFFENKKYSLFHWACVWYRIIFVLVMLVLNLAACYMDPDSWFTEESILHYVPAFAQIGFSAVNCLLNRHDLRGLINTMQESIAEYNLKEQESIFRASKRYWRVLRTFVWLCYCFPLSFVLPYILLEISYKNGNTNVIKFPMSLPIRGLLPRESFFSWKSRMSVFLSIWLFRDCIRVYNAVLASYMIICLHMRQDIIMFQKKILTWKNDPSKLKDIIIKHNKIIGTIKQIRNVFGLECLVRISTSGSLFCLVLYILVKKIESPNSLLMYSLGLILFLIQYLLLCGLGQILENEGENLSRTLLEINWIDFSVADRKKYLMILMSTDTPLRIDYRGLMPMTGPTFVDILGQCVSFFNLLLAIN